MKPSRQQWLNAPINFLDVAWPSFVSKTTKAYISTYYTSLWSISCSALQLKSVCFNSFMSKTETLNVNDILSFLDLKTFLRWKSLWRTLKNGSLHIISIIFYFYENVNLLIVFNPRIILLSSLSLYFNCDPRI